MQGKGAGRGGGRETGSSQIRFFLIFLIKTFLYINFNAKVHIFSNTKLINHIELLMWPPQKNIYIKKKIEDLVSLVSLSMKKLSSQSLPYALMLSLI